MSKLKTLETLLTNKVRLAKTTLTQFQVKLQRNPADALYWGLEVFEAAAMEQVCNGLLEEIARARTQERADDEFIASLNKHLRNQVYREVRNPARGTNPTANLMQQATAQACALLLETVEGGM